MDLPVTIIGGYLGAGKTTLINHMLRHNEGQRLAVLVNEFGDLSIDADLIEAEEDGLISISGGCVCCAFGSDLLGALEDMAAMTPPPDHVVIEASGVALPGSIATTVGLVSGLRPNGVLVLADADQIRANSANKYLADTIDRQLAQADILLVTKCDLVDRPQLKLVMDWLGTKVPSTRIHQLEHGRAPVGLLLGSVPFPGRRATTVDMTHANFASTVLIPDAPVDAEAFAQALAADEGVTRAKGFVPTNSGMKLIHVVGQRWASEPAKPGQTPGVVCIGAKGSFDEERLAALLGPELFAARG